MKNPKILVPFWKKKNSRNFFNISKIIIMRIFRNLQKLMQLHLQLLCKFPYSTIFYAAQFFNPTIRKPTTTAFQNTWSFDQYLFNSMSNMNVNLFHWNSLHSKKAIIPTFVRTFTKFSRWKNNNRTNNLHHLKAGSFCFKPKGWDSQIPKKWCNNFYNVVAVEYTLCCFTHWYYFFLFFIPWSRHITTHI